MDTVLRFVSRWTALLRACWSVYPLIPIPHSLTPTRTVTLCALVPRCGLYTTRAAARAETAALSPVPARLLPSVRSRAPPPQSSTLWYVWRAQRSCLHPFSGADLCKWLCVTGSFSKRSTFNFARHLVFQDVRVRPTTKQPLIRYNNVCTTPCQTALAL